MALAAVLQLLDFAASDAPVVERIVAGTATLTEAAAGTATLTISKGDTATVEE